MFNQLLKNYLSAILIFLTFSKINIRKITATHKPANTARILSSVPLIIKKLKKECNVMAVASPIIIIKNLKTLFL